MCSHIGLFFCFLLVSDEFSKYKPPTDLSLGVLDKTLNDYFWILINHTTHMQCRLEYTRIDNIPNYVA